MAARNFALCLDRGGVPNLEADLALSILPTTTASNTNSSRFFLSSYFDVSSLALACKATKRDALTEMGLRKASPAHHNNTNYHILLPRSPFAASCSTGYPSAEAGPCSDQLQGRLTMSVEKWLETVALAKPEFSVPVCDLASIPEMLVGFPAAPRKRQTFSTRNQKWAGQIFDKYNNNAAAAAQDAAATTATNSSSSSSGYLPQLVFPLGTHFEQSLGSNNNNIKKQQEQNSTGITVDTALYAQWSQIQQKTCNGKRFIALLNLGCGESRTERRDFLQELSVALQTAEAAFQKKKKKSQEEEEGENQQPSAPPLSFVVGNICDKETMLDFEEIFSSFFTPSSEIVYGCSCVPHTMSSRGLALQRFVSAEAAASAAASSLRQESTHYDHQAGNEQQRRDRDNDEANTTKTATTTRSVDAASASAAAAPSSLAFNVINMWDPAFKFSRAPLCNAIRGEAGKPSSSSSDEHSSNSLFSKCSCMACERHTAGYMHHLLDVHEMNSDILLGIHNLSMWMRYLAE